MRELFYEIYFSLLAKLVRYIPFYKTEISSEDYRVNETDLKGQCHEMVVEVRPWSGRLGLN
jgi:hypothetical protein